MKPSEAKHASLHRRIRGFELRIVIDTSVALLIIRALRLIQKFIGEP